MYEATSVCESCSKTSKAATETGEEIEVFEEEPTEIGEVQVFDFVDVPSYATVITGATTEPLYFLKLNEKGICDGTSLSDGGKYFKGNYLKSIRSRNTNFKKFDILPSEVLISPSEIFDTYVEIDEHMQLDNDFYKGLIRKALS